MGCRGSRSSSRANETPEQREARSAVVRVRNRQSRATETAKQREVILAAEREIYLIGYVILRLQNSVR